jgi:hypothetical protein
VAGARESGAGDGEAAAERNVGGAPELGNPLTRFGQAEIAGVEVLIPVLVLVAAGILALGGGSCSPGGAAAPATPRTTSSSAGVRPRRRRRAPRCPGASSDGRRPRAGAEPDRPVLPGHRSSLNGQDEGVLRSRPPTPVRAHRVRGGGRGRIPPR